jgi:hypothetical protein
MLVGSRLVWTRRLSRYFFQFATSLTRFHRFAPVNEGWRKTTFQQMQNGAYRKELEAACRRGDNLGCLLGAASGDLCTIDIDSDDEVEAFLALNPKLASSCGHAALAGVKFGFRVIGDYPARKISSKLKVAGTKTSVAEWRHAVLKRIGGGRF